MAAYWYTGTVSIAWTKRYVREDLSGMRSKLKAVKRRFRKVVKRNNFLDVEMLANKRKPIGMRAPQRQNFNSVYGRMQIRCVPNG